MVDIGGTPILMHVMKHYARFGYTDFVLCLGFRGTNIKDYFLNYREMNSDTTINLKSGSIEYHDRAKEAESWNVTLADTGLETMTAERVYRIKNYVGDEPFMVTYGDGVGNVDLDALLRFHQKTGRLATLTGVRPLSRWGVVETDGQGGVTGFLEKPQVKDRINAGFFVFEPGVFGYLEGARGMMVDETLPALAADGQLSMYSHDGFWDCMDTYRDFLRLNELWETGNAPWASGYPEPDK
jgi:glucose-1-phosphate cytidylyltransferase